MFTKPPSAEKLDDESTADQGVCTISTSPKAPWIFAIRPSLFGSRTTVFIKCLHERFIKFIMDDTTYLLSI